MTWWIVETTDEAAASYRTHNIRSIEVEAGDHYEAVWLGSLRLNVKRSEVTARLHPKEKLLGGKHG